MYVDDLDSELQDVVATCVESIGDEEFIEMLKIALICELWDSDVSVLDGYPCFWDPIDLGGGRFV